MRGVHGRCQHASAPRHDGAAGVSPGAGARALAPATEVAAHDVLRGDPQGELAVADPVGGAQYSVPHELVDQRVWARSDGEQLIVVHVDGHLGPREVARHRLTTPGRPSICDEHYPPRPEGALERRPRARTEEERAFLTLGDGAEAWLIKAAAAGAQRVRRKMAEAIDLAKLHGTVEVDRALKACADAGRFGDGDLASVLDPPADGGWGADPVPRPHRGALVATLDPQLGGTGPMTVYYHQIRALIDPEMSDPLSGWRPAAGRLGDPRRSARRRREPVAITLLACQARDLAFELLELAEVADRERRRP